MVFECYIIIKGELKVLICELMFGCFRHMIGTFMHLCIFSRILMKKDPRFWPVRTAITCFMSATACHVIKSGCSLLPPINVESCWRDAASTSMLLRGRAMFLSGVPLCLKLICRRLAGSRKHRRISVRSAAIEKLWRFCETTCLRFSCGSWRVVVGKLGRLSHAEIQG